ncbi:MAG: hypothetical protein PHS41_04800, partial [Victivallaceae bacterium]|nr:hypothetical protein [Victivallaceae bacterium]
FCPDWQGNRIFTSHMGEINVALLEREALLHEVEYIFSDTGNMAVATGCLKSGKALLSNLAPRPNGKFLLTAAPVIFTAPGKDSTTCNTGWFSPAHGTIADFLAEYSREGATHHLLVSYGGDAEALRKLAFYRNWEFRVIAE